MESLRVLLQQEFINRHAVNANYSLRAFAKHLGIYHATLSALISGKRKITYKTAKILSSKLGLDPLQMREITDFGKKNSASYYILQQDAFNSIAEWHFDAILELTKIKNLKLTPKLISEAIGISALEASLAIETLIRLELIRRSGLHQYSLTNDNTTNILDPNFTSAAMKKYQKKILQKSLESIDQISKNEREHTSVTMAVRKEDLPKAKELMKRFRREMNEFLQRKNFNPNEVYQLQISFFPLTKLNKKRGQT